MYLRGKRIFIIEDNLANITIMRVILEAAGALVFEDRWTKDTLGKLSISGHIDIIIMDLMLTDGMTGYELFDKIRGESAFSHIPIIIVSASDPALEMRKAKAKGFIGYIAKPLNSYTFAKAIAAAINGQEYWNED